MKIKMKYVGFADIRTSNGMLSHGDTFDVSPGEVKAYQDCKHPNGTTLFELAKVKAKAKPEAKKKTIVKMVIEDKDGE